MEKMEYETMWSSEIMITEQSKTILRSIAKWTKFLSILGFFFVGLSVLFLISAGVMITLTNNYMESASAYPYHPGMFQLPFAIGYFIVLLIYFVPLYFLYKFSTNTQRALKDNDTEVLNNGLDFLKKHYMFLGIMAIIMVAFYLIVFLIMLFGIVMNAI